MISKLTIEGINCYAYHGCLKEETKIGGNFRVDVEFEMDFSNAILEDELSETIDYVLVNKIVNEQMAIPSKLIEHVCGRIAEALKVLLKGEATVFVRITKFNPPVNGRVERTTFSTKLVKNQ